MKNRIHYGYRMALSTLVTYPGETLVDWELWLSAQHQKKGSYCILQTWGKNKNSNYSSYWKHIALNNSGRKIIKLNHHKLGTMWALFWPQSLKYQFSSVAQLCPTLFDPMNHSTPGFPVHHQLPESTQTHVHRLGDAIQPSHPLSSPSPPALNLSQYHGLFKWVSSSHQVAKVLEFQLQHHFFQWTHRTDLL